MRTIETYKTEMNEIQDRVIARKPLTSRENDLFLIRTSFDINTAAKKAFERNI